LQFAKARFAEEYDCVVPVLTEGEKFSRLILRDSRHPLLQRNLKSKGVEVVPTTLELEGERRELIITGPNTGGKNGCFEDCGFTGTGMAGQADLRSTWLAGTGRVPYSWPVLANRDYQSINAQSFKRNRFSAGVRPGDNQFAPLSFEFEVVGTTSTPLDFRLRCSSGDVNLAGSVARISRLQ